MKNSSWLSIIGWVVSLVIPVILLLTAIRVLLTPAFVNIEYRLPGFPADTFGMTQEQRLQYSSLALDYLLNDEDVSFLGDQQFEDGTPLYNDRELGHMVDVKDLTQIVLDVWLVVLVLLGGLAGAAWHFGFFDHFRAWLARGGQITVGLILVALVFIALSFNALFTSFHRIFFEGDTWLFQFSDTLIRMFPLRFWQDVFIALGALTLLGGGALWYFLRQRPKAKAK